LPSLLINKIPDEESLPILVINQLNARNLVL